MNITKAHSLLGRRNEEAMRQSARELGWVLTHGKMKPCEYCVWSKAKQKNVCKKSTALKAEEPGGRVYLDLLKVTVSRDDGSDFELNRKHTERASRMSARARNGVTSRQQRVAWWNQPVSFDTSQKLGAC